jgi:hypothetical protein
MTAKTKTPTAKKPDLPKPYVENYPLLKGWLDDHEARCNWQKALGDPERPSGYVESWSVPNKGEILLVVRADQHGWDIFTSNPSINTHTALDDANARLDAFRPKGPKPEPLPWTDVKHFIAQGAINIAEGLTTIAAGSKVHRAMESFCKLASEGLEPSRPRHTNEDE